MGAPSTADVRDMLCAQALAVVARAAARLAAGETLRVRYNAADVRRDLVLWAQERGYALAEPEPELLQFQRSRGSRAQPVA